jgi:WXG100 family type VII secretion target
VPQPIRVEPQELTDAAERLRGHAEQLLAGHGSAISTAEAAQAGLVGQSAQAIAAKTHRWQATTAELQRVLVSQADALASAASAYAQTEEGNRQAITSLDPVDP